LRVVDDPNDQDEVAGHAIENPVLSVNEAADGIAQFALFRASQGMAPQQVEYFVKAARIDIGHVITKLFRAIFIDAGQIGARRRAEPDFSHAARDVRQ
jgi:hypothetical protein